MPPIRKAVTVATPVKKPARHGLIKVVTVAAPVKKPARCRRRPRFAGRARPECSPILLILQMLDQCQLH
jgi:hypothetical protein